MERIRRYLGPITICHYDKWPWLHTGNNSHVRAVPRVGGRAPAKSHNAAEAVAIRLPVMEQSRTEYGH